MSPLIILSLICYGVTGYLRLNYPERKDGKGEDMRRLSLWILLVGFILNLIGVILNDNH